MNHEMMNDEKNAYWGTVVYCIVWALCFLLALAILAGCVASPEAIAKTGDIGFNPKAFDKIADDLAADIGDKIGEIAPTVDRIDKGVAGMAKDVGQIGDRIKEQRGLVNIDASGGVAVVLVLVAGVVVLALWRAKRKSDAIGKVMFQAIEDTNFGTTIKGDVARRATAAGIRDALDRAKNVALNGR